MVQKIPVVSVKSGKRRQPSKDVHFSRKVTDEVLAFLIVPRWTAAVIFAQKQRVDDSQSNGR